VPVLALTAEAAVWRELDTPVRWYRLFTAWRAAQAGGSEARARLEHTLELLGELPPGQGAEPDALGLALAWRHPIAFESASDAAALVRGVAEHMARLGAGSAGAVVGTNELGRAAVAEAPGLAAVFPTSLDECIVGADMRIVVAGPPSPELAAGLRRIGDLEAVAPARVFRLTEASVRGALDRGMSAPEILAFLESRSRTGIPQTVAVLIEDVGRRHGRLRVGTASFYVRGDDPVLLAELAASRQLRGLRPRLIAPTVALVEARSQDDVLEALRKARLMPVAESQAPGDLPRGRPLDGRFGTAPAAARQRPPDTETVLRLAGALAESPEGETPTPASGPPAADDPRRGDRVRETRAIAALMATASRENLAVEIAYQDRERGSITTRVIEPWEVNGDRALAWCRLRQAERHFSIRRVIWARATGERFEPPQPDLALGGELIEVDFKRSKGGE
jgi:hypothetical protein